VQSTIRVRAVGYAKVGCRSGTPFDGDVTGSCGMTNTGLTSTPAGYSLFHQGGRPVTPHFDLQPVTGRLVVGEPGGRGRRQQSVQRRNGSTESPLLGHAVIVSTTLGGRTLRSCT
jgi:hypothetical protein